MIVPIEPKQKTKSLNDGGFTPPELPQQRVFAKDRILIHDLYKLNVATMLKNISWTDVPDHVKIEHCHFFHTIDSDGKVQTTSNAVGGHFHEMEVVPTSGGVAVVKCGPPMKHGKVKVRGVWKKTSVPYDDEDNHVHDVQYISSCEIKPRVNNTEALKVISAEAAKTAAIPDVEVR